MKNIEIMAIVNAYTAQKETGDGRGLTLPAAVAWKRRVNMDKLFAAKKLIDDALQEIQQKYGDDEHSEENTDKDGNAVRTIKKEFVAEFFKAQTDILEQDTDVDVKKVKVEDLKDLTLSDADMDTIAFMLDD